MILICILKHMWDMYKDIPLYTNNSSVEVAVEGQRLKCLFSVRSLVSKTTFTK